MPMLHLSNKRGKHTPLLVGRLKPNQAGKESKRPWGRICRDEKCFQYGTIYSCCTLWVYNKKGKHPESTHKQRQRHGSSIQVRQHVLYVVICNIEQLFSTLIDIQYDQIPY